MIQRYDKKMKPPNIFEGFLQNNNYFLEKNGLYHHGSVHLPKDNLLLTLKTVCVVIQAGLEPALSHP